MKLCNINLFCILPIMSLFYACGEKVELQPEDKKSEIISAFSRMTNKDLENLTIDADRILPVPIFFEKSEMQSFIDHCSRRVETLRAFLNDVYSDHPRYEKIPYINKIFSQIALEQGYWDGKEPLNIKNIFHKFFPYSMKNQSFTYACDIIKGKIQKEKSQYYVLEDTVTGGMGGLDELPEFHWRLAKRESSIKNLQQYEILENTIKDFIDYLKNIKLKENNPELIIYSHDDKSRFIRLFRDAGFHQVMGPKEANYIIAPKNHKLLNFTLYNSFDVLANEASFYHNLLNKLNSKNKNYLLITQDNFVQELMNKNRYQSERDTVITNNFLIGHSEAVKEERAHVVNPLGSRSFFSDKLYGIVADELMEIYLGEKAQIRNPKTRFFYSYEHEALDKKLLEEVFGEKSNDWVIKKNDGLGGHDVHILRALSEKKREELKKIVSRYPFYFFAQPFIELEPYQGLIYEIRIIGFSSPGKNFFYSIPYVRGTKAGESFKTNIGSGGAMLPSFVISEPSSDSGY
jgi:hypothetical protein